MCKKSNEIFNIEKTSRHKIYTILGIKIRVSVLNAKKLQKIVPANYDKKIAELRAKKDKIRVAFLITENSKWQFQSIFEEMKNAQHFEPFVLVTLTECVHFEQDKTRNNLEENYNFFKSRNIPVHRAYDKEKKEFICLSKFSPDIVFYQQPCESQSIQQAVNVSNFALTFYIPYGLTLLSYKNNYIERFHRHLYKYFAVHDMGIPKLFRKKITNVTPVGHPRLDEYFTEIKNENIWREKEKIKIIYAPHHSFEKRSLKFGTFAWSGKKILELAKKYSNEATFILKPHPRFDYAILSNNIMTEDELNSFYKEWQVCGEIYDQGDYFDLFRTSDALITDCVSFLAEYLPTKKPIIQLKRKDSMKFNSFGKAISKDFYGCYNEKELDDVFEEVIINKNDFLKEKRIKSAEEIFQFKSKVSKKIIAEIEKVLG